MNSDIFLLELNSVKINKKFNHWAGNLDLSESGDTIRGMSWAELKIGSSEKLNWKNSVQVNSRTELRADSKSEVGIFLWFIFVKLLTCIGVGYRSPIWHVRLLEISQPEYSRLRWTKILVCINTSRPFQWDDNWVIWRYIRGVMSSWSIVVTIISMDTRHRCTE
jgi:hypothetical protein